MPKTTKERVDRLNVVECTTLMMDEMFDTNVGGHVKMGHKAS